MSERRKPKLESSSFELVPGRNCRRRGRADRAAPLVDAEAYFSMLYDPLHRA